ncbi:hypothetical protein GCM10027051_27100 [Niabella terrae]
MQRIAHLVQKLNQQISEKASPEQLLITVQMLQKELTGTVKENAVLGTSGISVVIPNTAPMRPLEHETVEIAPASEDKVYFELEGDPGGVSAEEEEELIHLQETIPTYDQHARSIRARTQQKTDQSQTALNFGEGFDAVNDIPTLAQHVQPVKDPEPEAEPEPEDYPRHRIKDLRKAIAATDRYAFIRELFRADEDMYERSIKTINNFSIYAEAEYWIKRELRTKMGWLPQHPLVIKFEQLVKSRFA